MDGRNVRVTKSGKSSVCGFNLLKRSSSRDSKDVVKGSAGRHCLKVEIGGGGVGSGGVGGGRSSGGGGEGLWRSESDTCKVTGRGRKGWKRGESKRRRGGGGGREGVRKWEKRVED